MKLLLLLCIGFVQYRALEGTSEIQPVIAETSNADELITALPILLNTAIEGAVEIVASPEVKKNPLGEAKNRTKRIGENFRHTAIERAVRKPDVQILPMPIAVGEPNPNGAEAPIDFSLDGFFYKGPKKIASYRIDFRGVHFKKDKDDQIIDELVDPRPKDLTSAPISRDATAKPVEVYEGNGPVESLPEGVTAEQFETVEKDPPTTTTEEFIHDYITKPSTVGESVNNADDVKTNTPTEDTATPEICDTEPGNVNGETTTVEVDTTTSDASSEQKSTERPAPLSTDPLDNDVQTDAPAPSTSEPSKPVDDVKPTGEVDPVVTKGSADDEAKSTSAQIIDETVVPSTAGEAVNSDDVKSTTGPSGDDATVVSSTVREPSNDVKSTSGLNVDASIAPSTASENSEDVKSTGLVEQTTSAAVDESDSKISGSTESPKGPVASSGAPVSESEGPIAESTAGQTVEPVPSSSGADFSSVTGDLKSTPRENEEPVQSSTGAGPIGTEGVKSTDEKEEPVASTTGAGPIGTEGVKSTDDSEEPVASSTGAGPIGTEGVKSTDDSEGPVASSTGAVPIGTDGVKSTDDSEGPVASSTGAVPIGTDGVKSTDDSEGPVPSSTGAGPIGTEVVKTTDGNSASPVDPNAYTGMPPKPEFGPGQCSDALVFAFNAEAGLCLAKGIKVCNETQWEEVKAKTFGACMRTAPKSQLPPADNTDKSDCGLGKVYAQVPGEPSALLYGKICADNFCPDGGTCVQGANKVAHCCIIPRWAHRG